MIGEIAGSHLRDNVGSYLQAHKEHLHKIKEKQEEPDTLQIPPSDNENDVHSVVALILELIYGKENITRQKDIDGHIFLAQQGNLVFDLVTAPSKINAIKIKAALTKNYSTEVIYLVPDRILTNHPQISYKNIADYVRIIQASNQSDLVRWISHFRNKAEADYERTKKSQSIHARTQNVKSENDIR